MTCPACGSEATGNYCANCGQRRASRIRSVRTLFTDLLQEQLSLDSKLPRTLLALFFRPGFLTREYLAQRISPYILPFRLYLWISVLFFLVVAVKTDRQARTMADLPALDSIRSAVRDSSAARVARGETSQRHYGILFDPGDPAWAENAQVNFGNDRLNRAIKARLLTLRELPPKEAMRRLMNNLVEDTPKVMFLLLPLCALLFKLVYLRSRHYYVEHFVFALHAHAFAFGLFLLMSLASAAPIVVIPLMLWLVAYSLLALKRVYEERWLTTTLKWIVLGQLYAVVTAFALVAALAGAALTL